MKKFLSVLFLTATLVACPNGCDNETTTGPTTPNPPPPIEEPEPEPTFLDRPVLNWPFTWHMSRTFTLFSGARVGSDLPQPVTAHTGELEDLDELFRTYQAAWPGLIPTARVCAEVQSWPTDKPWLPRGVSAKPFDHTAPAYKELKNFLDGAVRIPRAQVLVVAVCNLKEDGTSLPNVKKWVRNVCELAARYPNTAVEVVNEARHPNSSLRPHVNALMSECRAGAGKSEFVSMQVGSDSGVNPRHVQIIKGGGSPYEFTGADFYSYHAWRNPDPTKEDHRHFVRWGLPRVTVFSEQTCFDDEFGLGAARRNGQPTGNCTDDPEQIEDLMRGTEKAGGVANFHTTWGLGWPNIGIGWILDFRNWEVRHGS